MCVARGSSADYSCASRPGDDADGFPDLGNAAIGHAHSLVRTVGGVVELRHVHERHLPVPIHAYDAKEGPSPPSSTRRSRRGCARSSPGTRSPSSPRDPSRPGHRPPELVRVARRRSAAYLLQSKAAMDPDWMIEGERQLRWAIQFPGAGWLSAAISGFCLFMGAMMAAGHVATWRRARRAWRARTVDTAGAMPAAIEVELVDLTAGLTTIGRPVPQPPPLPVRLLN